MTKKEELRKLQPGDSVVVITGEYLLSRNDANGAQYYFECDGRVKIIADEGNTSALYVEGVL